MSSKLAKVGYLQIDHRDSPGLTEDMAYRNGLGGMPVGKGQTFESDTFTCVHCTRVVIINPLRTRDRAYCAKCDRYICDMCGAEMARTGVCMPFAKIVEEVQESASKGVPCILTA